MTRIDPEIVSIAPRMKLDDRGRPTQDAVIVIGIKTINPLRFGAGAAARPQAAGIPERLPVFTAQGVEDKTRFVDVVIEQEGEVVLESFAAKRRPCPGGYSIGHPNVTVGSQANTVFDAQGRPTSFPVIDLRLTDQP